MRPTKLEGDVEEAECGASAVVGPAALVARLGGQQGPTLAWLPAPTTA